MEVEASCRLWWTAAAVKQRPSRLPQSRGLLGRFCPLVDDAFRHLCQGRVGILCLFQRLLSNPTDHSARAPVPTTILRFVRSQRNFAFQ